MLCQKHTKNSWWGFIWSPTKAVLCEFQAQSHIVLRFIIGVYSFKKSRCGVKGCLRCTLAKTFSVIVVTLMAIQEDGLSVIKDPNCKLDFRIRTLKSFDCVWKNWQEDDFDCILLALLIITLRISHKNAKDNDFRILLLGLLGSHSKIWYIQNTKCKIINIKFCLWVFWVSITKYRMSPKKGNIEIFV